MHAPNAEEHPDEVLVAIDDKTDALVRELEEQERQARRDLRRGPLRPWYTPEQLAEVPFSGRRRCAKR